MTKEKISELLENLKGELPVPRLNLSEDQKDQLILQLGLKTVQNLLKAKKQLPMARIPFLFSSLDTQALLDVLNNDMAAAVVRAKK